MKLNTKIKIDFLNFIKRGTFDYIKLGQTKEWIINNFPDPDSFSPDFLSPNFMIWTYGNIEFHFDKTNKLFLIFSDYLHELNGGDSLDLNKWIFEDYSKLTLAYVLTQLNRQEIDYCKACDHFGVTIKTKGGVELSFSKDSDEVVSDHNELQLNSFGLMERRG